MLAKSKNVASPFFELTAPIIIESVEQLMRLNSEITYYIPGDTTIPKQDPNPLSVNMYSMGYETAGIFRGQNKSWPLIPASYREHFYEPKNDTGKFVINFRYASATHQFKEFSEKASRQNLDYPKSILEQMSIAQHYGIKTPLLDWSRNVLVALYFALDLSGDDLEDKNYSPYIYHIKDERMLSDEVPDESEIAQFNKSAFVRPYPIDRRVERQFGCFTYHPHPLHKPEKIPIDVYIISENIVQDLWHLMKGFGFSSEHFFPDYAGIAEKMRHDYML